MEKNWHISVRKKGEVLNTADQVVANQAVSRTRAELMKLAFSGVFEARNFDPKYSLRKEDGGSINQIGLRAEDNNGNIIEFYFDDVKIDVTVAKEIKCTPLINHSGTVKEFIQSKDYEVTIVGSLKVPHGELYPTDLLELMVRMANMNTIFSVANVFLEAFGIHQLVLERADFHPSAQQYFNILPFTLKMKSDEDYEFFEGI